MLKTKGISFNAAIVEQILSDDSRIEICTRNFTKKEGGSTISKSLGIGVYFKPSRWEKNAELETVLRQFFNDYQDPFEAFKAFAEAEEKNANSKVVYDYNFMDNLTN
ncbi:hypothetical protein LNTAR_15157 [Lentisphaera araneosa HTCC2155]|uniref:Uncharacterized protein n=1 Tax=Lentisphaera araneosa HTCC2155 TaxID=313628 RepID=A6DRF6_9BACT|nr:hypothetical protein [Lentisphaera araneosa]EDM25766.1 hypothetical protein LNTAR_15157 [Lentisphaera araneosa HTCC2155]